MQGTESGLGGLPGTTYSRPLEEHSFSTNDRAGETPTPQEKMTFVGWAEKPILAMQLHNVQPFPY